jgi:predicted metalloendopeptidase
MTRTTSPSLPGLTQYDSDQLFFMSFGTLWCETKTLGALASQLTGDPHPPHVARVTSTLRNMPEFAEAFKCKKEDPMVAEKPCKIW